MRDKEHRYDTRRRQIFLFPPLILRSETEQEKKHRATMQNWRHLEGGEASVKRYLMTDADKERTPKTNLRGSENGGYLSRLAISCMTVAMRH